MDDQRLGRRSLLVIAATGLVTAVLAVLIAHLVVGSAAPTYRATAQVALVPAPNIPAEQVPSYWEALGGGQAATIGAEVLKQSQWLAPAATAANVTPDKVEVTAAATASTSLITITATTTSPEGAEAAVTALITAATPTVQQVSGPYILQVAQPAKGTAAPASTPESQLLMVVFAGGLFIGTGIAVVVVRSRARRQAEEERVDAEPARTPAGPPGPGGPLSGGPLSAPFPRVDPRAGGPVRPAGPVGPGGGQGGPGAPGGPGSRGVNGGPVAGRPGGSPDPARRPSSS